MGGYRLTQEQYEAHQARMAKWTGNVVPVKMPVKIERREGPLILPWPPTGNTAVRHSTTGVHYLRAEVREYRRRVSGLLAGRVAIVVPYRLQMVLSPPDEKRRDADNAIKTVLDALVRAKYLPDDSMKWMRELVLRVSGRGGTIEVTAQPFTEELR